MQYFITGDFLHQTFDNGWEYLEIVIQKHLDRLTNEDQLELTREAFENCPEAYRVGEDNAVIPEDDDFDLLETACDEANFIYLKDLLHSEADSASSEYQEKLESDESEEEEEEEDNDEESEIHTDDSDESLAAEIKTANSLISDFLKDVIKNFDVYEIDEHHLPIIASVYNVTKNYGKYVVNGYIYFTVKDSPDELNFKYDEIHIDDEGMRLTSGGFITLGDFGGDSYSEVVFPSEEGEITNSQIINKFIDDFKGKLKNPGKVIESFDSGDGIEEK